MAQSEIDAVRALLSSEPRPVGWPARRKRLDEIGTVWPVADDVELTAADLNGVAGEYSIVPGSDPSRVLMFFHGGGYCSGSIQSHRRWVTEAGRAAGMKTLAVAYRLPKHDLDIVEAKPMETNMVTVSAGEMASGIAATGSVALYGILFDTRSAVVKPESMPTLDEVSKLLKAQPTLRLLVVGHTDNVGTFEFNMDLSQRRAASVVQILTSKLGIDPKRLTPVGVSFASPVASNRTEDGKSKNRRVQLVGPRQRRREPFARMGQRQLRGEGGLARARSQLWRVSLSFSTVRSLRVFSRRVW